MKSNFLKQTTNINDHVYRQKMVELIIRYQPLIYLHDDEKYLPCNFEVLFDEFKLKSSILTLKDELTSINEKRQLFNGNIKKAPFYVYTSILNDKLILKYYILYAFNEGKYILPLNKTVGNHFMDLEHIDLIFNISSNTIIPLQAVNSYHSCTETKLWDGKTLTYYSALGSHGMHQKPKRTYYNKVLALLNVYDDTTKNNKLFNPNKYIIFSDDNYNNINNVAFNEQLNDVSLELPRFGLTNWVNQITSMGGKKIETLTIYKKLITIGGGYVRNPAMNLKTIVNIQ